MSSQLSVAPPTEITYFGILTPVGLPLQCVLEVGGLDYKANKIDFADWAAMKSTTPTGVLPIAKYADGSVLVESGAIARAAAAAAGLLGTGKDFLASELLLGLSSDLAKKVISEVPTLFTVEGWTAEKTAAFKEKTLAEVLEHLAKYEQFLLPAGDRFTTTGLTVGELDLFAKPEAISPAVPEAVTPKLKAFYDRVKAHPAVAKILAGETQWGKLASYILAFP